MKVAFEKELHPGEVTEFVDSVPGATFFHTPAWLEALDASFPDMHPRWITAREGSELVGLMPCVEIVKGPFRSLWSLPFGTYGNPLARNGSIHDAVLSRFFKLALRPACLEARAYLFSGDKGRPHPPAVRITERECRLVRLYGTFEEYFQKRISKKRRQGCNRAERVGVEVRILHEPEEVEEFYRIYRDGSQGWGGVHPYPYKLFVRLFQRREEGVLILGGFKDGKLLGGHINLYYGEMAQGWQAGVSEISHQYDLGSLLVLHAVKEAYRRGMKIYNLGSSGENKGLVFFKESLGGKEYRYPVAGIMTRWWRWVRRR